MRLFYGWALALSLCVLPAACTQDCPVVEDPQYFIEVIEQHDFTFDDFWAAFGELADSDNYPFVPDLADKLLKDLTVTAYTISYNTVDFYGNPIVSSGVIYYPQNTRIRGVVEVAPIAFVQKTSGASDRSPATEGLQSTFGYLTIIPDFIGYGITQDTYHPFLEPDVAGRVGYDMRQASREFLSTIGYKLPDRTMVAGYSLGGSLAMAMVRYYEEHGVKIDMAGIGCGCYEPVEAFDAFARTGVSTYCLIPTVVYSINKYHDLNLDFSKVFTGELLEHYEEWLDRDETHSNQFLLTRLGMDMHNFMHPDFFTEAKNEEFHKIYEVLKTMSHVDGWTPKARICLYHAEDDQSVPYECALYAYDQFKKRGANISFYHGTGGHVDYAGQMFLSLYLYLLAK